METRLSFKGFTVVSCGVLKRELSYLINIGFLDADKVLYTEPGLHANRDELKSQLKKQLINAKKYSDKVIIVYGENCHPEIDNITKGNKSSILEAKDCIDMLADVKKRKEISNGEFGSIFWLSPGWLDYASNSRYVWERIYKDYLGWEDADAHVNFGTYRKAIFLDPRPMNVIGDIKYDVYTPNNIFDFSNWTHLTVTRKEVSLDRFKSLLARAHTRLY